MKKITGKEANECYNIPMSVLQEYEKLSLCSAVRTAWQYDDRDLERMSMIMTLNEIGFTNEEVETYMRLLVSDTPTDAERLRLLNKKRSSTLDEIHLRQKSLNHLDYLRHEIQKANQDCKLWRK